MHWTIPLALPATLVGMLVAAGPASAATALHWSTYLRSGPGEQYPVLAELEHDEAITVGACQAKWCKVSEGETIGYVDRDALEFPQPTVGTVPQANAACAKARLTSYPGPHPHIFCELPRKTPAATRANFAAVKLVGATGFEPATP